MQQLTETFRRLVERSEATTAQWVLWHLREMAERVEEPSTRRELEHTLRDSPELLAEVQLALDAVGAVVADAAVAARQVERLGRIIDQIHGERAGQE